MSDDEATANPTSQDAVGAPVERPVRPLPEGDVVALSDYFDADGSRQSLAYSGDQVRELLAAERERCAKLCEDISDEYQRREGMKYLELKSDAQTGASDCASAIRKA